jgi:xanthine dehydrogenase YagR molybdenum-binding subunit
LAKTLGIPKEKVRLISPFIGGGFGAKLWLRADALLAALGARAARRPVKVALPRALVPNNTTHRAATIQRVRIGATRDGKITALGHESWSGDLPGGRPEAAVMQTRLLYAGANRLTATRLAVLDLPEASSMRAPGEAPGMMALEIAIDEMAEKLGRDPVEFRILNDTQVVPDNPSRPPPRRTLRLRSRRSRRTLTRPSRSASWSSASALEPSASAGPSATRSPALLGMDAGWSAWA